MLFETTLRVVTVIVQFQSQYLKNVPTIQIFVVNVYALHVPIETIHKYGLEVRQLMYLPTYQALPHTTVYYLQMLQ